MVNIIYEFDTVTVRCNIKTKLNDNRVSLGKASIVFFNIGVEMSMTREHYQRDVSGNVEFIYTNNRNQKILMKILTNNKHTKTVGREVSGNI